MSPSPYDYKPKHKKIRGFAGGPNRGPERWARAAHNAVVNPMSSAAKLYRSRVTVAVRASELMTSAEPLAFIKSAGANWDPVTKTATRIPGEGIMYYACGVYCATMQAQLDHVGNYGNDPQIVYRLILDGHIVIAKPNKIVRCQVCARAIRP
jgi:hypothetical protein